MKSLNEEIMTVKEKMRKERKWREHMARIHYEIEMNEEEALNLRLQLEKEEEDVDRLQNFSLTNIFSSFTGSKQDKIDDRMRTITAAKLKYQETVQVGKELDNELKYYKSLLEQLGNVTEEYSSLIDRKEALILDSDSLWSEELYIITEKEAELAGEFEEYEEAFEAGLQAREALNKADISFQKAKGWSTFDLFGGGLLSTAMKHNHLDRAKEDVHKAEMKLRQFHEELLDINNHFQSELQIGSLLKFADYFFDGIIVNWLVHDKISQAASQISETQEVVSATLTLITEEQQKVKKRLDELSAERIKVIYEA